MDFKFEMTSAKGLRVKGRRGQFAVNPLRVPSQTGLCF